MSNPSSSRLLRTVIVVEVLHRDPIEFDTLADLHHTIDQGPASGDYAVQSSEELTPQQMHDALIKQGSAPQFLLTEQEMDALDVGGVDASSSPTESTDPTHPGAPAEQPSGANKVAWGEFDLLRLHGVMSRVHDDLGQDLRGHLGDLPTVAESLVTTLQDALAGRVSDEEEE